MSYSQALEAQASLVSWMNSGKGISLPNLRAKMNAESGERSDMDEFGPRLDAYSTAAIEGATAFYWSPEMCDVLAPIAATMPDWTVKREDLLVPHGFMHFSKPLSLPGRQTEDWAAPLAGVAWRIGPDADYSERDVLFVVPIVAFAGHNFPFLPFTFEFGEVVSAFFDDVLGMPRDFPDRPMVEQAMSYIGAAISLVRQNIIAAPSEQVARGTRKRLPDDWQGDTMVRVVQLRRLSAPRTAGSEAVEWSHRWVVSGHWRQQAVGPARSERRPIFILPHIKGPDDKPLTAQADRVFAVVR